jgi:hypothetical protein
MHNFFDAARRRLKNAILVKPNTLRDCSDAVGAKRYPSSSGDEEGIEGSMNRSNGI